MKEVRRKEKERRKRAGQKKGRREGVELMETSVLVSKKETTQSAPITESIHLVSNPDHYRRNHVCNIYSMYLIIRP